MGSWPFYCNAEQLKQNREDICCGCIVAPRVMWQKEVFMWRMRADRLINCVRTLGKHARLPDLGWAGCKLRALRHVSKTYKYEMMNDQQSACLALTLQVLLLTPSSEFTSDVSEDGTPRLWTCSVNLFSQFIDLDSGLWGLFSYVLNFLRKYLDISSLGFIVCSVLRL